MPVKKSSTYKRTKKSPKWQMPLLIVLVLVAVGFGIFFVFFSKAGTTSPQVYLTTSNTSSMATIPNSGGFTYGEAGDKIIACDWDGVPYGATNGSTVAAYRPSNSTFYISNNNASVNADPNLVFTFGATGDIPLCGNWDVNNGSAKPTVAVYRPSDSTFYLSDSTNKAVRTTYQLGSPGDIPIACDWNGDGVTDLGVYNPATSTFKLALKIFGSYGVFKEFTYGINGGSDIPVCGNWTNKQSTTTNEFSTVGVYRTTDAKFYLRNSNSSGPADIITPYGVPSDKFVPLVGNWTGTKQTFIGAYRPGNNAPTAPTNLRVNSASTSGVSLSWGAASDDGGTVNKYEVYRNGTWWATVSTTSYTDTRGLTAGTSYSYYVVALDGSDTRGPQSSTVTANIPKAAPPPTAGSNNLQTADFSLRPGNDLGSTELVCKDFQSKVQWANAIYYNNVRLFDKLGLKNEVWTWFTTDTTGGRARSEYIGLMDKLLGYSNLDCKLNSSDVIKAAATSANTTRKDLNSQTILLMSGLPK